MLFTNKRSISTTNNNLNTNKIKPVNNIAMIVPKHIPKPKPKPSDIPVQPIHNTTDNTNKIIWGAPFWYFFHILAEKVKPESFNLVSANIHEIIKEVCSNLPCPYCKSHAVDYMSKINFKNITSSNDLKLMLFTFHNSVNKRTNKPDFSIDELNSKYKQGNIVNIVNHFLYHYKMEHHVIRAMVDNMYRKRSAKRILDWFHANTQHFNLS